MRDASKLDIICQQNDPKTMSQVHQGQESIRIPDVIIIPFSYDAFPETIEKVDSRGPRLKNAMEQPQKSFGWKDVLACIEFKRPTKKKDLPRPKEQYTVEPYVFPNPPYRRVEDPVLDAPATVGTSISQTQAEQPALPVECKQLILHPEAKLIQLQQYAVRLVSARRKHLASRTSARLMMMSLRTLVASELRSAKRSAS
jgi:hypothetical protein